MYCHALEMYFYHKLLMNLLRIINGEKYVLNPFSHSKIHPPSLSWKISEIKNLAAHLKEDALITFIDEIYILGVRHLAQRMYTIHSYAQHTISAPHQPRA